MNNSKLAIDSVDLDIEPVVDRTTDLQGREARIIRILEAIESVQNDNGWSSLKNEVFDPLTDRLKRDLLEEARKDNPDTQKLARLTGELKWAERYTSLDKLASNYRVELQGVRMQLHGKSE